MKTRFAPSPTGYIHLGNARTALFSFLLAQSQNGQFLLRIEDSDTSRSLPHLAEQLQADLLWLGLPWQEGPGCSGSQGPYFQSKRQAIYQHYYDILHQLGRVYPCFCTPQNLLMMRKSQLAQGKPPRYTGVCRHLSESQRSEKKRLGEPASLRFQVPLNLAIRFDDIVKGQQLFHSADIGDFIIQRSDGSPAFFFCNAIDDALMQVSHVLRGEDHLTNTPRQIMLLQTLSLPIPTYGHLSLIVGEDLAPLSKRHGSFSLQALRDLGYLPEALQNYLARLGHTYVNPDFMDSLSLAKNFSIERLGKASARYDVFQLNFWQKQALARCTNQQLLDWMDEKVKQLVPEDQLPEFIELVRYNVSFPSEALHWASSLFSTPLCLSAQAENFLTATEPDFWLIALELIQEKADFKTFLQTLQQRLKLKGKALFAPLRMALTGRLDGPELGKVYTLLGFEKLRERILYAKNL